MSVHQQEFLWNCFCGTWEKGFGSRWTQPILGIPLRQIYLGGTGSWSHPVVRVLKGLPPVSDGFGRFWNVMLCSLVHGDQCFRGIYSAFLQSPLLYVTARWNHIEDLDSFFARMYHYHQKHGFTCMMLQETLELLQFIFVVVFSTFLFHCVDYSVLFRYSYIL
jgi:hypothetical protein